MNLIQAFGFTQKEIISFIGTGGKTSVLFQIARQYKCPVLITTTTHISELETGLADHHIVLDENNHLKAIDLNNLKGVILITGPRTLDAMYGSPKLTEMEEIYQCSQNNQFPLLIEADGSREESFQTTEDNEPEIPTFSTCVVNVVDLAAIGKPLGEEWGFRSDKFSEASDLGEGEIISANSLTKILSSKNGCLKYIEDNVNKYLIFIQADNIQLQALAGKMADDLIPFYEKIVICQLSADQQLITRKKPIGAIILAAGGASRFGKAKQLNIWREKSYTENAVIAAQLAGLAPIIVVTGYEHENLERILKIYPVQTVFNPEWEKGQSTSMKIGLGHLEKSTQGVIFLMADQPQVSVTLIRALMEHAYLTNRQVISPMIDGNRSTPIYFDQKVFPELMKVEGDQGGRSILSMYPPLLIEWFDIRMGLDIDFVTDINYLTTIE